jgi:hypothetical protein
MTNHTIHLIPLHIPYHGDVAPFGPWLPRSVYTRWVRLGEDPVDWVGGSVVGAMGARPRGEKKRAARGGGTKRLAVRTGTSGSSHSPSTSLSLSLSSHCSPSLSYARVTTSLPPLRAAREQQRQHPPTDRRWAGRGRSDAGAAVMAAPSGGGGGGAGEGSSSAAAAATIGVHGVDQGEQPLLLLLGLRLFTFGKRLCWSAADDLRRIGRAPW